MIELPHAVETTFARSGRRNAGNRNANSIFRPPPEWALLSTILVFVTSNGVPRVGGVDVVIVDFDQLHSAVHEGDDALRPVIKRSVLPSGPASVPRQGRMGGPLHH